MFVGHVALALIAKRKVPAAPLGWLVAAVMALDLLWPIFLLLGVEQVAMRAGATAFNPLVFESYPWSHSLLMAAVWGLALAALAKWRGYSGAVQAWLAGLVVSHWVLDWITHAPDLPLWPGDSPRLGLGLWNSVGGTYAIEGGLWLAAIVLYLRDRRALTGTGRLAFWSLVAVVTLLWAAAPWSPPPPSVRMLAGTALALWLLVPWASFADRRFVLRPVAATMLVLLLAVGFPATR
ncbi:MAG TPA: metal-dependent hydrolase [Gemmatimonadales bacterium]